MSPENDHKELPTSDDPTVLRNDKGLGDHVEDSMVSGYIDPTLHIDPAENARLVRTIHWHLLPFMCIAYITQSLDKGTLGVSSIMGWQKDVGAVGQDYALTSTILWAGVIVGEPVVNQLIRRLPVAKVLGVSMLMWTGTIFALAFTKNIPGIWAIRFFLGFFEAAFAPCLLAITVQWYHKSEQPMVTTIWQGAFGVSSGFSSLMGYAFIQIDNSTRKIHGWQWLHVLVGVLSLSSSLLILFFLPDSPTKARWATEDEKVKFVERVRDNDQGIQAKRWRSDQAKEAFTDPLAWLLVLMIFVQTLVNGGLYTFNTLLINRAFGFDAATAQLLGIPLAAFQVILYFLIGWLITKTGQTIYCMTAYVLVNMAGSIVLITVKQTTSTRTGLLICYYFMQCIQALNPSLYSMLSRNVAGHTKRSIVYALFFVAWAGGNAIGPQLFQAVWAPRYVNTLYIHIGLYIALIAVLLGMRVLIVKRNAKRDARLVGENIHANAFGDMSDLQNMEFRYSY